MPPAIAAAVGAALLLITRTVEPRRVYDEVDWGLLVFFVGLFVIVGGADRAGLTATLLHPVQAWDLHRLPVFVVVTAVLSNVVSNVPAVMLLRRRPGVPGSGGRLARSRDGLDARGEPHDHGFGREHHRRRERPVRACT